MTEGPSGFGTGYVFELARLNRALTQVARPTACDDWNAPMTHSQLVDLGVFREGPGAAWLGEPRWREELIERLWSRKRQLLRDVGASESWPGPPAA